MLCINLQLRGGVHWRDKEDVEDMDLEELECMQKSRTWEVSSHRAYM